MSSDSLNTLPMFATPVTTFDVPDAATLNADLRRVILEREKSAADGAEDQCRRLAVERRHGQMGRRAGDQAAGASAATSPTVSPWIAAASSAADRIRASSA